MPAQFHIGLKVCEIIFWEVIMGKWVYSHPDSMGGSPHHGHFSSCSILNQVGEVSPIYPSFTSAAIWCYYLSDNCPSCYYGILNDHLGD